MKANKGLGSSSVLSLSRSNSVVEQKSGRERLIEILAIIGWIWILWWLMTQTTPPLP